MEQPKRARRRKPDTAKVNLKPLLAGLPEDRVSIVRWNPKGMRTIRAVIDGGHPKDFGAREK